MRSVHFFKDGPGPGGRKGDGPVLSPRPACAIRGDGDNESEDATLAARNAYLAMIDHLVHERGFNRQQAYAICSVAVDLTISEIVDVPNVVVSAFLPLDIFI